MASLEEAEYLAEARLAALLAKVENETNAYRLVYSGRIPLCANAAARRDDGK